MASSVVALASASMDDTAPVASREDVTRLSLTNVHASERLMVTQGTEISHDTENHLSGEPKERLQLGVHDEVRSK